MNENPTRVRKATAMAVGVRLQVAQTALGQALEDLKLDPAADDALRASFEDAREALEACVMDLGFYS